MRKSPKIRAFFKFLKKVEIFFKKGVDKRGGKCIIVQVVARRQAWKRISWEHKNEMKQTWKKVEKSSWQTRKAEYNRKSRCKTAASQSGWELKSYVKDLKKSWKNFLKKFLTSWKQYDKITSADSEKRWGKGHWSLKTEQLILNYPKLILKFKKRTIKITRINVRNISDRKNF